MESAKIKKIVPRFFFHFFAEKNTKHDTIQFSVIQKKKCIKVVNALLKVREKIMYQYPNFRCRKVGKYHEW